MANKKISQLTAKGSPIAPTDLVEIAEDAGGGNYVTKSVSGLQPTLVSGTNIASINSASLLGGGNVNLQTPLVSGTDIKTINGSSVLGSGNLSIAAGQIVPAVSTTIGTTITGLTNAISDSFLLPANTFSSNCTFELQWFPSRIAGTGTATQGLVYINSTNSLTGATLFATGGNITATGVSVQRCSRNVSIRSNIGTLALTSGQASSDYTALLPTENLPFDNTSGIYFLFVMNNVAGATLQSRNVGYRLIGYNL